MSDDNDLTPAEIAAGMTPERKRRAEEESGVRDVPAITAKEKAHRHAEKVILGSARKLKQLPRMLGRVHSDI
jgi:hypothetical protein